MDYTPTSVELSFDPGDTVLTILLDTVDDSILETNEQYSASLSNPSGAILGVPSTTTILITENDCKITIIYINSFKGVSCYHRSPYSPN